MWIYDREEPSQASTSPRERRLPFQPPQVTDLGGLEAHTLGSHKGEADGQTGILIQP